MTKIIFYQSNFCQMGGVETFAYNWCWWLRNYFDVTVLYCSGDPIRIAKMRKLVKMELYDENKEYECDIFIRNSVWGKIPHNVKATRMIEMRHANYKWLLEHGYLMKQYTDMGIKEIVGCGEFVSKMSHEALGDNPTTIKNILLPNKETHKVLHLISCTRIDANKGWNRMLKLAEMLRNARIKFEWNVFTNSTMAKTNYEEIHVWSQRDDIWDYLTDADYTVLLSDSEGLPYTVQESLQYKVPCIVTDVGGCTELIKDGINGYVVPLDMNFDVRKILDIPKCKDYDNHALEDWLKYLGYEGKVDKQKAINNYEEEKEVMVKVRCIYQPYYDDVELKQRKFYGDVYDVEEERAKYLASKKAVEIIELPKVEEPKEEKVVEVDFNPKTEKVTDEMIKKNDEIINNGLKEMIFGKNVSKEKPKKKTSKK